MHRVSSQSSFPPIRRYRDWACLSHSLLWAYEGPVPESARDGEWEDADTSCWLIEQGEVTVRAGGRRHAARRGQWVFVAGPSRHQRFSADARILSVHFRLRWPGGEPLFPSAAIAVLDAREYPQLERAARPLVRLVARHFNAAGAWLPEKLCSLPLYLRVQTLLPRWLAAYLDAQAQLGEIPGRLLTGDARVLQLLEELERRPVGCKFSERELTRCIGLGRARLDSLFVQETGLTPRRYHERRRLAAAESRLSHTCASVKEIALELGFADSAHFCRWFRGHKQTTPLAFRRGSCRS